MQISEQMRGRRLVPFIIIFGLGILIFNSCARLGVRKKPLPTSSIGAVEYISADYLSKRLDFDFSWNKKTQEVVLEKNHKKMRFKINESSVDLAGEKKEFLFPALLLKKKVMVPRALEKSIWWTENRNIEMGADLFRSTDAHALRVVIDAGHGGFEAGARHNGVQEKDITLNVALRLRKKLAEQGVFVIMTRDTDTYLSLPDRTWITKATQPDLLLSIHANAAPNEKASGVETFHVPMELKNNGALVHFSKDEDKDYRMKANDLLRKVDVVEGIEVENRKKASQLAKKIHKEILKTHSDLKDRGVKQAEFFVLKWANVPSVLIELGFVSNLEESERLSDSEYQEKLATQIASGVMSYLKEEKRN